MTLAVLYGSIQASPEEGQEWLKKAATGLVEAITENTEKPKILWSLFYSQEASKTENLHSQEESGPEIVDRTVVFSDSSTDLAFDDSVLREVRRAWQHITENANGFMDFEDREVGEYDDE